MARPGFPLPWPIADIAQRKGEDMQISRMEGPFGVTIEGIDLASDMTDDLLRRLIALLHEHQIIAIRGQRIDDATYVRFGHKWGKPLEFMVKSHTRDDFPEMIRITN